MHYQATLLGLMPLDHHKYALKWVYLEKRLKLRTTIRLFLLVSLFILTERNKDKSRLLSLALMITLAL